MNFDSKSYKIRVQLGLIRLPSVGFSLGQFCVNHLPIFPQETLPGLNGSSPFIQARPCLENPWRWLCERRVLLDPTRTSGGLMATTCGPRGGAHPLRTNSSGVEKESECSPENLFVSFGAVWKLFIELRAGGEDKEGCITWGQDSLKLFAQFVFMWEERIRESLVLMQTKCSRFYFASLFVFLSVGPIIIANVSITAFVSGVLFCCTLSADFFNVLQLANYAMLWCNNWPVDSLTLFFFFFLPQSAKAPKQMWCSSSTARGVSARRASPRWCTLSPTWLALLMSSDPQGCRFVLKTLTVIPSDKEE